MSDTHPSANREISDWFRQRHSRRTIVKTTTTHGGETLDWIPIESQHPRGRIATPPPPIEPHTLTDAELAHATFELDHPHAERGPSGTVPILRKRLHMVGKDVALKDYLSKRGGLLANRQRRNQQPTDPRS